MLKPEELPHYTYDDYVLWKGDWELIDGIPHAMTPSPTITHQRVSQKIARYLDEALDDCPRCQALIAVDWIISDDTVVQPDNLVICHDEQNKFITQAPVLILEILSPSTAKKDQTTKFRIYEQQGVKWYCLVDPETQSVKIYRLDHAGYVEEANTEAETQAFDLGFCIIELDFGLIWPE